MERENLSELEQAKIEELLQRWEEARPFFNNLDEVKAILDEAKECEIEPEFYEILLNNMRTINETF